MLDPKIIKEKPEIIKANIKALKTVEKIIDNVRKNKELGIFERINK